MSEIPWLVPGYPPLKCDDPVGKAAVEGQLVHYPRVVRTRVDNPIVGQKLGIVSFMLFKKPRKFKTGQPCYGYFKIRGNWESKDQAEFQGSKIIREIDSRYQLRVAPVGHWLPITEEEGFARERIDVKTEENSTMQDDAVKEKQKEQRMIMREIREREEELKEGGDVYDDKESLRYYAMRRVTEMRLTEARDKMQKQLEGMQETIKSVRTELKKLDRSHLEYINQWIDVYNEERKKGGIPPFRPAEDLFDEYEKFTLPEESDQGSSSG